MSRLVGGKHPVEELLENQGDTIRQLFVLRNRAEGDLAELVEQAHRQGHEIQYVDRDRLDEMYDGGEHRGVVATCGDLSTISLEQMIENSRSGYGRLLVLDQVQDPVNLGTLARSGLFFHLDGIIKSTDRTAPLSETVVESSAGAASRLPFAEVTNLRRALDKLKEARFWLVGADAGAEQTPADVPRERDLVIILGNEGSGLRRLTREECDYRVRLEGSDRLDSLNVGVAGSVLMHALSPPEGEED